MPAVLWLSITIILGTSGRLGSSTSGAVQPPPEATGRPHWVESATIPWVGKARDPRLKCAAAMVVDNKAGQIVYARNVREVRPIASLTKLLTSLVFLESGTDLNQSVTITADDAFESSRSRLRAGEVYSLDDLLHAALMASDNRAARALSRSAGMPQARFIARMNDRAHALGMDSTYVIEPTGLSTENVSTAYDCAILINAALKNPLIAEITATPEYTMTVLNKGRTNAIHSTNRLLSTDLQFVGAKTGFILAAGWCMAARALSPDGADVTAVVLGAPSSGQRFRSLRAAFQWAFGLLTPSHGTSQTTTTPQVRRLSRTGR
ncbi:MAG: D-alanyl-D-alanine carboxypeptidase [candidate division Zixibacteria bacterium]|nr:D-alanyl-D-alanine carboxypeptidase [candidate division Zixibacteria bacterium]